MGNNKQLALAWSVYADDNGDIVPSTIAPTDPDGRTAWMSGQESYLSGNPNNLDPANHSNWDVTTDVMPSLLWNIAKNAAIYRCPADVRQCKIQQGLNIVAYPVVRSMSMNQAFASTSAWINRNGGHFKLFRKKGQIPVPTQTFVFAEEAPASINDDAYAVECDSTLVAGNEKIVDFPAVYHGGRSTTFAFADGHAEIHTWHGSTILHCPIPHASGSDYAAGDSSADVDWLVQNTSTQ